MSGIVVGVDRSATARAAAEKAAEVAERLGEPLHLVMAVKPGRSQVVQSGGEVFFLDWFGEAREFLRDLISELGARDATFAIGGKDPARSVCDEARRLGASLIVVGNRRTQGAARVLGSVATDVLRQAPCGVLVAHTSGDTADVPPRAVPGVSSAGEALTRQGEIGREFGVLLEGRATVPIDGREVARLAAGDHFGEIALPPTCETPGWGQPQTLPPVTAGSRSREN